MNTSAVKKREIYNKLEEFTEQDLTAILTFIDFINYKKHAPTEKKKIVKLEGIWKGYTIDFADLKTFRDQTWQHVEEEWRNCLHFEQMANFDPIV